MSTKKENPCKSNVYKGFCGERGIRTPGPVTVNSFQDCRNRPLCHSSSMLLSLMIAVANIESFSGFAKTISAIIKKYFLRFYKQFICLKLMPKINFKNLRIL
jgi:hypothetical protein